MDTSQDERLLWKAYIGNLPKTLQPVKRMYIVSAWNAANSSRSPGELQRAIQQFTAVECELVRYALYSMRRNLAHVASTHWIHTVSMNYFNLLCESLNQQASKLNQSSIPLEQPTMSTETNYTGSNAVTATLMTAAGLEVRYVKCLFFADAASNSPRTYTYRLYDKTPGSVGIDQNLANGEKVYAMVQVPSGEYKIVRVVKFDDDFTESDAFNLKPIHAIVDTSYGKFLMEAEQKVQQAFEARRRKLEVEEQIRKALDAAGFESKEEAAKFVRDIVASGKE